MRHMPALVWAAGVVLGATVRADYIPIQVINDTSRMLTISFSVSGIAQSGLAGAIKMDVNRPGGGGVYAGDSEVFWTYCLDVAPNLYLGYTYNFEPKEFPNPQNPPPSPGWVTDGIYKAAYLFNTQHDIADANPPVDREHAAALQVAIWECLYDTTLNLANGVFALSTTGNVATYAQQYLALVQNGAPIKYTSTWLDPKEATQSLLYRPVPDAGSTLAMLGIATLGVCAIRSRNRG